MRPRASNVLRIPHCIHQVKVHMYITWIYTITWSDACAISAFLVGQFWGHDVFDSRRLAAWCNLCQIEASTTQMYTRMMSLQLPVRAYSLASSGEKVIKIMCNFNPGSSCIKRVILCALILLDASFASWFVSELIHVPVVLQKACFFINIGASGNKGELLTRGSFCGQRRPDRVE